jgi:hypothetical protein
MLLVANQKLCHCQSITSAKFKVVQQPELLFIYMHVKQLEMYNVFGLAWSCWLVIKLPTNEQYTHVHVSSYDIYVMLLS